MEETAVIIKDIIRLY